ncbi:MAG: N-acetylneuraminic acid mutarotase [Phycisphaerales bacterium]|nr:N-acetylneuraminic acid mutarotase [Phycisphaerales bacterium]
MRRTTATIERLESRDLLAGISVTVDFQPAGVATQAGMIADVGSTYAARNGYTYGWDKTNTSLARDRNASISPNQAYDTFNTLLDSAGAARTWQIAVPNGKYNVRIVSGDATSTMSPVVKAEGITVISGVTTSSNHWIDATKSVTVADGKLTLTNGSTSSKSAVCFVQITSADGTTPPPTTSGGWPSSTSAWKTAASSPINRFESHAFSYHGKLYVMGGWANSTFNSTKRVDVYDPATNTWKRLKDMAAPETHAGAAMDEANGVIYFVGGHRNSLKNYAPTNELWKYTFATDTWTKLSATLPYKMGANTCQIVNGKLYSFGGNYADRVTNDPDTFMLDLSNISAGFKKVKAFPSARDHLSSVTINNKIYAFGGEFGHDKKHDQQDILQRYDPATDTWTRLASMPGSKSHAESSSFVMNGKIIIAGGQKDPQDPSSSVYQYDPATNKWTYLSALPAARQGTVVQLVGNYLVMTTGGISTENPQRNTWVVKLA